MCCSKLFLVFSCVIAVAYAGIGSSSRPVDPQYVNMLEKYLQEMIRMNGPLYSISKVNRAETTSGEKHGTAYKYNVDLKQEPGDEIKPNRDITILYPKWARAKDYVVFEIKYQGNQEECRYLKKIKLNK